MTSRVALLALVLAAGCSAESTAGRPTPPPTTPPPVTAAPTAPATTPGPSRAATSADFGFLVGVVSAGPPVRLRFDRALFLTGDAANKAAAAAGQETPVPNDYFIVNDNPLLRVLTLAPGVQVVGSAALNADAGQSGVEPADRSVAELLHLLQSPAGRAVPFQLVLDAAGRVTRVTEQYVP